MLVPKPRAQLGNPQMAEPLLTNIEAGFAVAHLGTDVRDWCVVFDLAERTGDPLVGEVGLIDGPLSWCPGGLQEPA